jgi:hypothetical protein
VDRGERVVRGVGRDHDRDPHLAGGDHLDVGAGAATASNMRPAMPGVEPMAMPTIDSLATSEVELGATAQPLEQRATASIASSARRAAR